MHSTIPFHYHSSLKVDRRLVRKDKETANQVQKSDSATNAVRAATQNQFPAFDRPHQITSGQYRLEAALAPTPSPHKGKTSDVRTMAMFPQSGHGIAQGLHQAKLLRTFEQVANHNDRQPGSTKQEAQTSQSLKDGNVSIFDFLKLVQSLNAAGRNSSP